MQTPGQLGKLMQALRCLPGVGPKTAQRMAFHLLERNREGARILAETLLLAVETVGRCQQCRTLTEAERCSLCADPARDHSLLCVVETPADVFAVNQIGVFRGLFFVLHGNLSPLDGVGPEQLGLTQLEQRLASAEIEELILATNSTVESEATAHFISEVASRYQIRTTRLARGLPSGGELEYLDSNTLSHAFSERKTF